MPACSCARSLLGVQRFWLLRLMGMLASGVDLQMAQLRSAELVMAEHAANRSPDHFLRPPVEEMPERLRAKAAGITAVARIGLRFALVARDRDSRCVDDDDVIAGIEVGLPRGLVLALQDDGDARGETTEGLARGIGHEPASFDLVRPRRECLRRHRSPSLRGFPPLRTFSLRSVSSLSPRR